MKKLALFLKPNTLKIKNQYLTVITTHHAIGGIISQGVLGKALK